MTILDWLKATSRYTFEDTIFQKIAIDREISVTEDVTTLTVEQKELLTADIIFTAVVLSPSSTALQLKSHGGAQYQRGSETISKEKRFIDMNLMKSIYKKYDDPRYYQLSETSALIQIIPIEDVL
jgi:hypothetical protein